MKKKLFTVSVISIVVLLTVLSSLYFLPGEFPAVEAGHFLPSDQSADIGGEAVLAANRPSVEDYGVYYRDTLIRYFPTFNIAADFAKDIQYTMIKQRGVTNPLWHNYPPYAVYTGVNEYTEFDTYEAAVAFADRQDTAYVYRRENHSLVYEKKEPLPTSALIKNVPHYLQMPELPRGCEVTSLAMLINYRGISVDKMTLADQIEKNTEPYTIKNGMIYCGDPNDGFIGSMTSFDRFGFGVYHKPVFRLLARYFPDTAVDLTGAEFEDLYPFIAAGTPVWVIINSFYGELPDGEFEQWHTPNGVIDITYREHAVLITGYDEDTIYFHDPLGALSSAPKSGFIKAWEQMGRQAVSVYG